ncbi:MAG: DUF3568 family protein [Verrucomicrobia bacterium]|nr:DUF3568 family protein [Verrucomicrobiota bacterium]
MNSNSLRRSAAASLVIVSLLCSSGCVAVVAGAGAGAAVAYVRGDLDAMLDAGLDKSLRAANRAIEQLKFAKISQKEDALIAILVARNAADKKIEIRFEKQSETVTKVKIRVGTFGDEVLSVAILDKVKANL